jgi:hypothetical protein
MSARSAAASSVCPSLAGSGTCARLRF